MTSKEFVIWMKGFITACNEYAPTPKQWDIMKEELEKVSDEQKIGTPIGQGGWGTPNVAPIQPLNWPINPDPYNPYKITCTPGTTGFVTIANPNIASFGTGSTLTYNPSTSTTYGYPSGSAWSYTTSNEKIF